MVAIATSQKIGIVVQVNRSMVLMLLAGLLVGCQRETPAVKATAAKHRSESDNAKTTDESPSTTQKADEKPAFSLSADEVSKEFSKDSKAAQMKYTKKIVEISGVVSQVFAKDGFLFQLNIEKDKNKVTDIGAYVDQNQRYAFSMLFEGQKVKIAGRLPDFQAQAPETFNFVDCKIIALEPSKVVEIGAEELANEQEKNNAEFTKKYKSKDVIIKGMFIKIDDSDPNRFIELIVLQGSKKSNISIASPSDWLFEFRNIKGGTEVWVRANATSGDNERPVRFENGRLAKIKN